MSVPDSPLTRLHVTVRGRVQGVGFRWFAKETADGLGLGGWVRNLRGGDVELEAQGTPDAVRAFESKLRTGHPYAKVDSVESREIPTVRDAGSFNIR